MKRFLLLSLVLINNILILNGQIDLNYAAKGIIATKVKELKVSQSALLHQKTSNDPTDTVTTGVLCNNPNLSINSYRYSPDLKGRLNGTLGEVELGSGDKVFVTEHGILVDIPTCSNSTNSRTLTEVYVLFDPDGCKMRTGNDTFAVKIYTPYGNNTYGTGSTPRRPNIPDFQQKFTINDLGGLDWAPGNFVFHPSNRIDFQRPAVLASRRYLLALEVQSKKEVSDSLTVFFTTPDSACNSPQNRSRWIVRQRNSTTFGHVRFMPFNNMYPRDVNGQPFSNIHGVPIIVPIVTCRFASNTPLIDQNGFKIYPIYPNPVFDAVNIRYELPAPQNVNITILDPTGKSVIQKPIKSRGGENSVILDVAHLPCGTYTYIVHGSTIGGAGGKFVIVR